MLQESIPAQKSWSKRALVSLTLLAVVCVAAFILTKHTISTVVEESTSFETDGVKHAAQKHPATEIKHHNKKHNKHVDDDDDDDEPKRPQPPRHGGKHGPKPHTPKHARHPHPTPPTIPPTPVKKHAGSSGNDKKAPTSPPTPPPVEVEEPAPVEGDDSAVAPIVTPNCNTMSSGICTACVDGYTLDSSSHLCFPTAGLTDPSTGPVIPVYTVPFCWRSMSMTPHLLTSCQGSHSELIAGLCYTPCNEGYASDGGSVTTCSEECGSGAKSTGFATCIAEPFNYRCDPCGAWAICHNCDATHTSTGGCLCTAKSWGRKWYDRGVGIIPGCPATQVQAGALCYDPCPTGFHEDITPLQCKMSTCPAERPFYCGGPGGAACTVDSSTCWKAIEKMIVNSLIAIGTIAGDIISAGGAAAIEESAKSAALADVLPRLQDIIAISKQIVADAAIAQQALDQALANGMTSTDDYKQFYSDIEDAIAGLISIAAIELAQDIDPTGLVNMGLSFVFPNCGDADSFGWRLFMEFLAKISPIVA